MNKKRVVIIGAGPGGLTAGMLLASKGFEVRIFEKQDYIGGRNGALHMNGYTFDIGPTFLMMKFILEEVFAMAGRRIEDYLDIKEVDPMYRLVYSGGREFLPSHADHDATMQQLDALFPGSATGYRKFLEREKTKFHRMMPCLQVPYESYSDLFSGRIFRAAPYLDAHKSIFSHMKRYFNDDELRISFTFQAKYLGMSPWECPGIFSIISYIEHDGGIWHPIGGLNQISQAMAKVIEEYGGRLFVSQGVKELLVEDKKAVGVLLENGEKVVADHIIINADFAYAMNHLVNREHLAKWTPEYVEKKKYSCSTFMLYLGVNREYSDIPHHNILFADDYKRNLTEISKTKVLSEDPSVYFQNACGTDPTLAPKGKSTIYVLVPVPNNTATIDWDNEWEGFRERVIHICESKGGLRDLRKHIEVEKVISPATWEKEKFVYNGATFNLAHNVGQMLMFRPHNRFEDIGNCYLVGGGTHPGSGLPTIYESGRITSDIIGQQAVDA
ncbi:MAG: phytoene desaturase family protein [bacterium]